MSSWKVFADAAIIAKPGLPYNQNIVENAKSYYQFYCKKFIKWYGYEYTKNIIA